MFVQLPVQEEEVWHAVVQWGQHRAGVRQTMLLWTEEHRQALQEALEGVLKHIRLSELPSDFISREVSGCGHRNAM